MFAAVGALLVALPSPTYSGSDWGGARQVSAEPLQQSLVSRVGNRTDPSGDVPCREHREEPKPNERRREEPAGGKVLILFREHFIEALDALVELRADAAHEEVTEPGKLPTQNRGTVLEAPICLGQRRQDSVALFHRLAVYSGLASVTSAGAYSISSSA